MNSIIDVKKLKKNNVSIYFSFLLLLRRNEHCDHRDRVSPYAYSTSSTSSSHHCDARIYLPVVGIVIGVVVVVVWMQ